MTSSGRRRVGRPPASDVGMVRRRIVRAARIEFGERGYAGATFEQIGQRVGLTRPAVNHHFGSKQVLYRDVLAQTEARIAKAFKGTRHPRSGATLLTELSELFTRVVALDALPGSTVAFIVSSVLDTHRQPQFGTPPYVTDARTQLTAIVRGAVERGELPPDTEVAALVATLTALLCGVAFCASAGDHHDVEVIADQMRRLLTGTLWQIHSDHEPAG